jgi:spore germination cell wall hydrolase CwlJ-like protein
MSIRSKYPMRRALIVCTAVSIVGVGSALLDCGLSRGWLWQPAGSSLRGEVSRLAPALQLVAQKAANAWGDGQLLAALKHVLPAIRPNPVAAQHLDSPMLLTASTVPVTVPSRAPEPEPQPQPEVNRHGKGDRLTLPELAVAKLVLPAPEPIAEGASAALFLMSPSIAAPALTPPPEITLSAAIVSGPVASAGPAPFTHAPAKNPFVTPAIAAAVVPAPSKITWNDLVRMASMKGGDGEEPSKIFGALTEKEFRAREVRCMATAIYFEARDESIRGQIAVGQVIMTRVRSDFYPNTICGVVYQGQWNRNACQFSFACDGIADAPKEQKEWETALDVAKQVISGKVYLTEIGGATHYHATYVHPDWVREVKRIKQIGGHIFYKAPYVQPLASNPAYQAM